MSRGYFAIVTCCVGVEPTLSKGCSSGCSYEIEPTLHIASVEKSNLSQEGSFGLALFGVGTLTRFEGGLRVTGGLCSCQT